MGGYYLCVHLEGKHDLGRTVPPRRDVLGHDADLFTAHDAGLDASG